MSDSHKASKAADDDPRLIRAMEDYLAALEKGIRPDRQLFLARYPDVAVELAVNLECIDFLHDAAPQIKADDTPNLKGFIRPLATLGDYRIVRELGRGGMGVVYEAEQLSLGRRVALKVLPFIGVLDDKTVKRFKTEARAAASLEHPHIVQVHAVSQDRGVHFFAMSLIDGLTLAQIIANLRKYAVDSSFHSSQKLSIDKVVSRRGESDALDRSPPVNLDLTSASTVKNSRNRPQAAITTNVSLFDMAYYRRIAELGIQAAEALQFAHDHGIVHRDIKPGNLMIDGSGKLWVTDFGLAQFDNDANLTLTGDLLGTIRYMSPEQTLGSRGLINHSTDVYSLGVTLYELLTLQPPFSGSNRVELLRQITSDDPIQPNRLNKTVPIELATIVIKAISKSPADRYTTMESLAADLRRWLEHKAILARKPTLRQRFAKWSKRNRSFVIASSVLAVVTSVALLGFAWWQKQQNSDFLKQQIAFQQQRLAAEQSAKQAEEKIRLQAQVSEREAQRQLYYADMRAGLGDWQTGNLARLSERLLRHVPRSGAKDLRGWEWYRLLALCHQDVHTLTHRYDTQVVSSISPDGKSLASAGVDTTVKVYENHSWQRLVTWISPNDGIAVAACWSPDSQKLAWGIADEGDVHVMDINSKQVERFRMHTGAVSALCWSPVGQLLASGGIDQSICLWNRSTSETTRLVNNTGGEIRCLTWHPSGEIIAATIGGALIVFNANTGEQLHKAELKDLGQIAWSPDGRKIALGTLSGQCELLDAADYTRSIQWKAHSGAINSLAWDTAQNGLLTAGGDRLIKRWNPSTAHCETVLRGHLNQVQSISIDRSGHIAVSSGMDGLVKVWALPKVDAAELTEPAAVNRDSKPENGVVFARSIVTGHVANGSVETLEIRRANNQSDFTYRGILSIRSLDWSPDGNQIAVAGSGEPGDGANLARAGWIYVFDVDKPVPVARFRHGSARVDATCVAWSPDGKYIVSGDENGLVEIRELSSKRKLVSSRLHTATIRALDWSPDGQRIASGSTDQSVRLWEPRSSEELMQLEDIQSEVIELAWSADGRRLKSVTIDGKVHEWDASLGFSYVQSDHYYVTQSQNFASQASQLVEAGDVQQATSLCRLAIDESTKRFGREHRETLWTMSKMAVVLYDAGQVEEAIALWDYLLKFSAEQRDDYSGIVNLVLRRASAARSERRMGEAKALYDLLLRADVRDHFFLNKLAWELATCPDEQFRDPQRAVSLALMASKLQPSGGQIHNTLGVAYYQAGDWTAAVETLLKAEEMSPNNRTAFNAFFLARAYWQLKQKENSTHWFDVGVRWMEANKHSAELKRIYSETLDLIQ